MRLANPIYQIEDIRFIRVLRIMLFSMWNPKPAKNRRILSAEQTRISLAPAWIWHLIICGALLEAISTLLPWGVDQLYLPWSLIIGDGVRLLASKFLTVSVLIRAATIAGWIGVILHEYVESRHIASCRNSAFKHSFLRGSGVFCHNRNRSFLGRLCGSGRRGVYDAGGYDSEAGCGNR